jgi:ribosomal protein L32E|tara:strand:+ start:1041 stop:1244 length:204 start_codon:yes stop_codon:yes gene_type:complete
MEKDKLDLIKKIITLVDTKEGLKKIEDTTMQVLRTQWDKDEKDKVEFEKWRKDKSNENSDSVLNLPL